MMEALISPGSKRSTLPSTSMRSSDSRLEEGSRIGIFFKISMRKMSLGLSTLILAPSGSLRILL
jgi:hypothetical protein